MRNQNKLREEMLRKSDAANKGKLGRRAADEVYIAWPVMLQLISEYQIGKTRVLDYGCGTGGFCRRMHSEGFQVEGIDPSAVLVRDATRNSPKSIRFHAGSKKELGALTRKFDIITAFMMFQYMEDLEAYLPIFHRLLEDDGMIVFSVHNPEFVESCCRDKVLFRSLRTDGETATARMHLPKGGDIQTYVRTKEEYKEIFSRHGFEFLSSRYPPFTPEFVAAHKWSLPSDNAEYLIMSMRKK